MNAITEILVNIFSACEYKVNKLQQFNLIVEKDDIQTIIQIGKPSINDILTFASDTQINENKLYITPGSIPEDDKNIAQDNNVCVWDRDILEANIGRVILADAEGSCEGIELPITTTYKDDTKSEFTLLRTILSTRSETKVELDDDSSQNIIPNVITDALPQQPEVKINTLNINTTPLKLNKDTAISIGRKEVSKPKDAVLLFIPFWSYRYSFNIEKKFKSKIINLSADESGVVNAVNGFMEQWNIDEILSDIEVTHDYEIKNQTVSHDDVYNVVIREAISKNTKIVGINTIKGQEIVSENYTIKPEVHEITVDLELVYIPVWEVKGISNSVLINATTHKIFSNPVDDDAEFV